MKKLTPVDKACWPDEDCPTVYATDSALSAELRRTGGATAVVRGTPCKIPKLFRRSASLPVRGPSRSRCLYCSTVLPGSPRRARGDLRRGATALALL